MSEDTKDVDGVQRLHGAFLTHASDVDKRISRLMVVAGGRVVKNEAKRLALSYGLKRTGAMIANIAIKRETKAPAGTTQYNLGVRHGRDLGRKAVSVLKVKGGRVITVKKDDPFYWIFHEFGWIPRGRGARIRGGERRRAAQRAEAERNGLKRPGTPFIGPALENKRGEAVDAMEARLAAEIAKVNK